METTLFFVLVPLLGYTSLWVLGIILFLVYFKLFKIKVNLKRTTNIIKKVPPSLAVITVPICSFISFFFVSELMQRIFHTVLSLNQLLSVGLVSLITTIILDLIITVVGEKIDIRVFPMNLMYLLAWAAIIPAVLLT